jgi:hypothetical protein
MNFTFSSFLELFTALKEMGKKTFGVNIKHVSIMHACIV